MTTYERVCIQDYTITAQNGDSLTLTRGKKYITSRVREGHVTVFSSFWVPVPVTLFAGEVLFTGPAESADTEDRPRSDATQVACVNCKRPVVVTAVNAVRCEACAPAAPSPAAQGDAMAARDYVLIDRPLRPTDADLLAALRSVLAPLRELAERRDAIPGEDYVSRRWAYDHLARALVNALPALLKLADESTAPAPLAPPPDARRGPQET